MYRTVVTICTAQWSLYVPQSGHYMYRKVVAICTAQWSLYVPHNGHYMYRKVVIICTAQWSLYVPQSGHYMYSTMVTICTAQWSLYLPQSGHCIHSTVVIICTAKWSLYVLHSGYSKNSALFVEPEGSFPYSQKPATCPNAEPDQSIQCPCPTTLTSPLILYSQLRPGFPSLLLPSGLPSRNLYAPLLSPISDINISIISSLRACKLLMMDILMSETC